ncbi:MAG TPA: IS3 family transposase [Chthonomonadaceae bacterium]|nr:IS3 family transposase [Chthonomonadaceae bacterium]
MRLIERADAQLPLTEQAALLSLSRSSLYYVPRPSDAREVAIKHRRDELFTHDPCLGARRLAHLLREEGMRVDRKTVRAYMLEMGLEAIYPKPDPSQPAPEHRSYPYLLRGVPARYPNHIWGVDITYVRLLSGWMYLDVSGSDPGLVLRLCGELGTQPEARNRVRAGVSGSGFGESAPSHQQQ